VRCFTRTVEMAPKGAKAACSASTDGGAAPSHTTLTDLALNDLIVASRELIVPSALPSAWGNLHAGAGLDKSTIMPIPLVPETSITK